MFFPALLALACTSYEAQISSRIKQIEFIQNEPYACLLTFELDLSSPQSYSPHRICPLDPQDVKDKKVYSTRCHFEAGEIASGYLVLTEDKLEFE